jgi:hypothetical protein
MASIRRIPGVFIEGVSQYRRQPSAGVDHGNDFQPEIKL